MFRGIDIAQHYEELIPSDNIGTKESHKQAEQTLERIEKMRKNTLISKGILLKLKADASSEIFKEGKHGASDNAPKLKIGAVMAEKAISRERLQTERSFKVTE